MWLTSPPPPPAAAAATFFASLRALASSIIAIIFIRLASFSSTAPTPFAAPKAIESIVADIFVAEEEEDEEGGGGGDDEEDILLCGVQRRIAHVGVVPQWHKLETAVAAVVVVVVVDVAR